MIGDLNRSVIGITRLKQGLTTHRDALFMSDESGARHERPVIVRRAAPVMVVARAVTTIIA